MGRRPVVYDITRLVTRIFSRTPNGIDRVDFAFANHFIKSDLSDRSGLIMTALGPRILTARAAGEAVDNIRKHWGEDQESESDRHFLDVAAAVDAAAPMKRVSKQRTGQYADALSWIARHGLPLRSSPGRFLADGGAYLNVSQFLLDYDFLFQWSDERTNIDKVFFIHDLLPIEFPEYFRPPEQPRQQRKLRTLARRGRAAIVSTNVVREALRRRLAELGRRDMPILVAPLPADPIFSAGSAGGTAITQRPYFVVCGTIEPRKNHLLLLHIWRDIVAEFSDRAPKLVVIGERGWENEHVIDLLERCPSLRGHVIEASGLPTPSVRRLLSGARALLMPSFAEGYGLPVVEALAAGVPVIASDIAAFREIGGVRLLMIDPTDGPKWRRAICAFTPENSQERRELLTRSAHSSPPQWPSFFAAIEDFILDLSR
jgi:glycosyltransferase involved in cell wall biosynthesis